MEEGLLHSLRIAHKNSRVLEAAPIPLLQQVLNQRTALKENSCLSALLPLLGQKKPTEPLSFLLNIYREFVFNNIGIRNFILFFSPAMGKNSAGHIVKGLRGLFRPKAKPRTRPPSPSIISTIPPTASTSSPVSTVNSAPQNPPDAGERTESAQETEQDKPHNRLLFDDEVKAYAIASLFIFSSLCQRGFKI